MLEKISNYFALKPLAINKKDILLIVIIAFCISVAIRMYYPYQVQQNPNYVYNGSPIIVSMDGYYFAEGARDILRGTHEAGDRSPIDSPMSILTAFLYKTIPFISFDKLIFYMPALFSSLIVVPFILLGYRYHNVLFGFLTGIVATVGIGYYNRTIAGYYDDDLLNLVLPFVITYLAIENATKGSVFKLVLSTIVIAFYTWWYANGYLINIGFLGFLLIFTLLFDRENKRNYDFIVFGLLAASTIALEIKIPLLIGFFIIYRLFKDKSAKTQIGALVLLAIGAGAAFVLSGGLDPLIAKWKYYIFKSITDETGKLDLHYYSVLQTVNESRYLTFPELFFNIAGEEWLFWTGLAGFLLMSLRYKHIFLFFPLFFIGFSAIDGGARFAGYGSPILAMGAIYLVFIVLNFIKKIPLYYALVVPLSIGYAYPSYNHIKAMLPAPALTNSEISTLVELGQKGNPEDYVYSWWDYGYAVRFYSNMKTFSDGGKHDGGTNFIESLVLTAPNQRISANLLRETTEMYEKSLDENFTTSGSTLGDLMLYGYEKKYENPNELLQTLEKEDYNASKPSRDVFLMVPYRAFNIFNTIKLFSNRDLKSGTINREGFFYYTQDFSENNESIDLRNGIVVNKKNSTVTISGKPIPIGSIIKTKLASNDMVLSEKQDYYKQGPIAIIYLTDYKAFLVVDQLMFNSTFVQLFVFNNANKKYFEPYIMNPIMKVYKLKI